MAEPRTVPSLSPEQTDKSATKSLKVCPDFLVFNDISSCIWSRSAGYGMDHSMPTGHGQLQAANAKATARRG